MKAALVADQTRFEQESNATIADTERLILMLAIGGFLLGAVWAFMPDLDGIAFSVGRRARGVAGHFDAPSDVREFLAHLLDDERDASLP